MERRRETTEVYLSGFLFFFKKNSKEGGKMVGKKSFFSSHWLSRLDEYTLPPHMLFGFDSIAKAGGVAKKISKNEDVIVVTDKALMNIGLVDDLLLSLKESGFKVDIYAPDAIEPTIDQVHKVIEEASKKDYGLVIGIGGGSSLDRAKMAACFGGSQEKIEDYLAPSTKPIESSKPKMLIPTTSGTGSEVSNTAVVIVPEKYVGTAKTWITGDPVLAESAIIDPSLMMKLPPTVTANTGFDALSHCAEGVISKQANPFSDALALEGIRLTTKNLRAAYHEVENPEARWNMALAAALGGMVISFGWVAGPATLGHAASEGISPKYNIPHGAACAVLLPYVYWFNLPNDYTQRKLSLIADAMGVDTCKMSTRKAAEAAIEATFNLMEDLDISTDLKSYGMKKEDIPIISQYILERSEKMYSMSAYNPKRASLENLENFFEVAYEGRERVEQLLSKRNWK